MNERTLCKKATMHQVTSMLATSRCCLGNNQSVGSLVPVVTCSYDLEIRHIGRKNTSVINHLTIVQTCSLSSIGKYMAGLIHVQIIFTLVFNNK